MTGRQYSPRIPRGTPRWKPRATRAHNKREIRRDYPPPGWLAWCDAIALVRPDPGITHASFLHRYGGPGVANRRAMNTTTAIRRTRRRALRRAAIELRNQRKDSR